MGDKGQNNALRESFRSRYSHGRLKLSMEATVEKTEQVRRRRMPTEDWQKSEVGNVLWRVESLLLHIFENFNSLISNVKKFERMLLASLTVISSSTEQP